MVNRGKSINVYLMDGTATGRVKCTLANWTGVAYKIPRTELEKCKNREDLKQSGVYFLFGSSDLTNESVVYIGQAGERKNGEGILYRLQEHKRTPGKDYWTEAVVLTTSNNSFGPTEISYLEHQFCKLATEAKRYTVTNANEPTAGHITEEKESELQEFIENSLIVIGTLGHNVFEPLVESGTIPVSTETTENSVSPTFYIRRSGADAQCKLTNEGVVVLAGSKLREDLVPSCPDYAKSVRKENRENIDEHFILQKDILFKSPSGASSFVLGAPTNGTMEWKTAFGQTMKEFDELS